MKKIIALVLTLTLLVSCFASFSVNSVAESTDSEEEVITDIISWFNPNMTVSDVQRLTSALTTFSRDGVTLADTDVIATGDKIVGKYGYEYIASVKGDPMGEGEVTPYSYLAIKRCYFGTFLLEGASYEAADVDKDGAVNEYDYLLIKRAYMGTYTFPKLKNAEAVPVLLYHHILPDKDKAVGKWASNEITIAISEFRRHLNYIKQAEINVVLAEDVGRFVKGEILLPPQTICITFDDGYKSNTYYAAPILREFGFKATVFSVMHFYTGEYQEEYDTENLQHITAKDLEPWTDVIDQQSHTYNNHNMLGQQLAYEVYDDLMLSQAIDYNTCFAYPNGSYSASAILAVKDAGFKYAFTTAGVPAFDGADPYLIPRYTITSPMNDNDFLSLLSRAG